MENLQEQFGFPETLMQFVRSGFLKVSRAESDIRSIEFHIPGLLTVDLDDRRTSYSLRWTHPEFAALDGRSDDELNFELEEDNDNVGSDLIELPDVDALVLWLEDAQEIVRERLEMMQGIAPRTYSA